MKDRAQHGQKIVALVATTLAWLVLPGIAIAKNCYELRFAVAGLGEWTPLPVTSPTLLAAPASSRFAILDNVEGKYIVESFSNGKCSYHNDGVVPVASAGVDESELQGPSQLLLQDSTSLPSVSTNTPYLIEASLMPGWLVELVYRIDAGTIAVPFKLHSNDWNIGAGATIGPYVGVQWPLLGMTTTFGVAAGLSLVPLQDVNADSVDTKTGLTLAAAFLVQPLDQFQVGVVVGADHLGGPAGRGYKYEDRLWVSLAVGFSFTQGGGPLGLRIPFSYLRLDPSSRRLLWAPVAECFHSGGFTAFSPELRSRGAEGRRSRRR